MNLVPSLGQWSLTVAILEIVIAGVALLVLRHGVLDWRIGLLLFVGAIALAAVAFFLAVVAGIRGAAGAGSGATPALVAVIMALVVLLPPTIALLGARDKPAIHDITTAPDDPPVFVAARALRKPAMNALDYTPEAAEAQRAAYPDIAPVFVPLAPGAAFAAASKAARRLGWTIVEENEKEGRIEAVATSALFAFRDDIAIRISTIAGVGARIDIRSASRVGVGDLGANARRIRAFANTVREAAGT